MTFYNAAAVDNGELVSNVVFIEKKLSHEIYKLFPCKNTRSGHRYNQVCLTNVLYN